MWQSKVFDIFTLNKDLTQLGERFTIGTRLDGIFQSHVHPTISLDQDAVNCFAGFELHKKWLSLCMCHKVYWQLKHKKNAQC